MDMGVMSNFERARKLTADWPSWKRDYQLTKNLDASDPPAAPTVQPINAETLESPAEKLCDAFSEH
jgi:hypothetical protein